MKKYLDNKYFPLYFLLCGVLVFIGAFIFASKWSGPKESEQNEEENQLTIAGGEENATEKSEVSDTPTVKVTTTPTVTVKPKVTLTPTVALTNTPTPQPTSAPTDTPTPELTSTPTVVENSPTPTTNVESATPTTSPTPTDT